MLSSFITALTLFAAPVPVADDAAKPALLIGFDDLQRRLDDRDLRLLDVRSRADYDRDHIPGAVWFDTKAAEKLASRKGGLEDKAAWEALIAPLGIGADSTVFVYGENRQLDAARVWWLLRYLGMDRVGLIDGNYSLWTSEKRPTSAAAAQVTPQPVQIRFRADRLATRDEVTSILKSRGPARVIDARTSGEHLGT